MIICIAGLKGGVTKTTTAVHFATYLQSLDATVLVDGDPNRSASAWYRQSNSLPFKVISEHQLARYAKQFTHIVIDTKARPEIEDFRDLLDTCDLLVLPTPPTFLDLKALIDTAHLLQELGSTKHKVLLTRVPTHAKSSDEADARELLAEQKIPVFKGKVRYYKVFEKAALAGVAVCDVKGDRASKIAWKDYQTVIREALDGKI